MSIDIYKEFCVLLGIRILCFVRYSIVGLCIIFIMIFETINRGEIARKFLERFSHKDFLKVNLYLFGKWDSFKDKLWIWVKEIANIVASSFKNLPDICGALRDLVQFNTAPSVFFTFLKLYKWYQIAQRITYCQYRLFYLPGILSKFWR